MLTEEKREQDYENLFTEITKNKVKESDTNKSHAGDITNPGNIAELVFSKMNSVNNNKEELTIAIKGLSEICQQLVLACSDYINVITELKYRIQILEGKQSNKELNSLLSR